MASLDFDLEGKPAVVTGGANGIGLAASRLLAVNGASEQIGAGAFDADVTSRESLDAALAAAGIPDIVVANAGIAAETDIR